MHLVAKTYGRLPSELLQLTWPEYQFCVAVLMTGLDDDGKKAKRPVSYNWGDLV